MDPGAQQHLDGLGPKKAARQPVPAPASTTNTAGFVLSATRGLFTSYEAAAIHDPDADRLHRDDAVKIHPSDAAALGITDGDAVVIRNSGGQLSEGQHHQAVQRNPSLPLYYDGRLARPLRRRLPISIVGVSQA
jgi:hypothetical protein